VLGWFPQVHGGHGLQLQAGRRLRQVEAQAPASHPHALRSHEAQVRRPSSAGCSTFDISCSRSTRVEQLTAVPRLDGPLGREIGDSVNLKMRWKSEGKNQCPKNSYRPGKYCASEWPCAHHSVRPGPLFNTSDGFRCPSRSRFAPRRGFFSQALSSSSVDCCFASAGEATAYSTAHIAHRLLTSPSNHPPLPQLPGELPRWHG
jgi:hypothetical protein